MVTREASRRKRGAGAVNELSQSIHRNQAGTVAVQGESWFRWAAEPMVMPLRSRRRLRTAQASVPSARCCLPDRDGARDDWGTVLWFDPAFSGNPSPPR